MLNETYRAMLGNKSVIRETFMYGRQRAAQIGSENGIQEPPSCKAFF